MKPNIFDIATKELNQDAFITWLLKFADPKYQSANQKLNTCGKTFVTQLIKKQLSTFDEQINKVEAGRQWENIDVWAEINEKYLIIIEDKINSSHHSNQLSRYKENAEKWCKNNNYKEPICIYLKTGNESQSRLSQIEKNGYSIFSRLDFINLLNEFKDINNDIFIDFYERLKRIEKSNNEFENKIIKDWNGNDWQGFFQFLEKEIPIENWDYVNNASGGFWNAVLNWDYWNIYPAYIQLEEGKLCFKISTDPNELDLPENLTRGEIRNHLHKLIMNQAKNSGFENIKRPTRFGNGNYMTVAIVNREDWLGKENETIDKENIVKTLTEYVNFLRTIIVEPQKNVI
ncbi:PD-(D/E)XK nuclease family protein [Kaistella pullorum]|uniref:PD-(D/E)XK nuclease family protein n=1 Tax=Kaistella pullorum TaxID=2763074 RepID=A0ABR8WPQ7_9FLAO|nr:PD-(D/E)XK nuclease family protein [Kaistella pullorum]MBD8019067.1 PD-(D/E)XK nuclease family protein [Kaistella pullorum]